jgi:hypothetical protein
LGFQLIDPAVIGASFSSLSYAVTMPLNSAGVWSIAEADWLVLLREFDLLWHSRHATSRPYGGA